MSESECAHSLGTGHFRGMRLFRSNSQTQAALPNAEHHWLGLVYGVIVAQHYTALVLRPPSPLESA